MYAVHRPDRGIPLIQLWERRRKESKLPKIISSFNTIIQVLLQRSKSKGQKRRKKPKKTYIYIYIYICCIVSVIIHKSKISPFVHVKLPVSLKIMFKATVLSTSKESESQVLKQCKEVERKLWNGSQHAL